MGRVKLSRRQFLQAAGLTGLSAITAGCSDATRKLIPFVIAPDDIVPGEATWYATTCRECPAGCGMLAKNREGRVIKVEGNPLHPINTGKLCARGQASVQGVYNPDRYKEPLRKAADGKFTPIGWDEAEKVVVESLARAAGKGHGKDVVFLTDLTTGSEEQMIGRLLAAAGSGKHIMYEPLAYEALRQANGAVFGSRSIPAYRIDEADFLISFGANFLETWVSNIHFTRQFAAFHEPRPGGKNLFVYVGPRLSMTAANADLWIPVPPGTEGTIAYGLLHLLLRENYASGLNRDETVRLKAAVSAFTPESVIKATGVKKEMLDSLVSAFLKASRPLALAEGLGLQDLTPLTTARAANLLCRLAPGSSELIDFATPSALSRVATTEEMKELIDRVRAGRVEALFLLRANPAFHLPPQWGFTEALKAVPLVVSLSSYPDESSQAAHLILPIHTFLESWGDYEPYRGIRGIMQPVMGPMFNTRPTGDILLSLGRAVKGAGKFPEKDFYEVVRSSWPNPESAWEEALQRGGEFGTRNAEFGLRSSKNGMRNIRGSKPKPSFPALSAASLSFRAPNSAIRNDSLSFISYPTVQFFDGRMGNRPFIQERPDPMTQVTWDGWVEIHPETAGKLGIGKGDMVTISSGTGSIIAPAFLYPWISPETLAMPLGQGHSAFGRYAVSRAGNPALLAGGLIDEAEGVVRALSAVKVEKTKGSLSLAHTDGSVYQHNREIARSLTWEVFTATAAGVPEVTLPLPEGFTKERDFYPAHTHDEYRWAMAVDLDRCIGCAACVVACYAENNVAVVGKEQVLKGREMAWLHIQRYYEEDQPYVHFLPMLCQHCDEAPCESVCPVFAPNHSKEGINNQVYNRCIGTRFCNQNCPYKIRRFNWFTWKHDRPLEWQLNPEVTVRTKGVMEKCSFCIQRVNQARITARSEGRLIRDNEFSPACVQTCPADALVFGNLKDPESRVAKLVNQTRAYQVLRELNTKPGVIYLKKITRRLT